MSIEKIYHIICEMTLFDRMDTLSFEILAGKVVSLGSIGVDMY